MIAPSLLTAWIGFSLISVCGAVPEIQVNGAKVIGTFRPLHGVNGSVITYGGLVDLSARFREAGFPHVRLHDCQWPSPSVVDIHTIFRDFRDDAAQAENYSFQRTDDFIEAIVKVGAQPYFRLGESIEHSARQYDVHPPADFEKWASVCVGIVRHYNDGWAGGFRHGIRYWEIWNEPDVRPQMWSGTDADYYRLYGAAAQAIKARFPDLKVGGPAVGTVGEFREGKFHSAPFVAGFLEYCRTRAVPLDFFSWHRYTDNPADPARHARAVRSMLDQAGFTNTESHLNEWNYLPRNDWGPLVGGTPEQREAWFAELAGPAAAAFTAGTLLAFQDVPLDLACFYTSETHGFGLFSAWGRPSKSFHAMRAFRALLDTPMRLETFGNDLILIGAGIRPAKDQLNVLVACRHPGEAVVRVTQLPWNQATRVSVRRVDAAADLDREESTDMAPGEVRLPLAWAGPSVLLVRLTPR